MRVITTYAVVKKSTYVTTLNGRFQMQKGKNWILPKEIIAKRFFWDSHWLEIWSNHLCPSMGPNGRSVAMESRGIEPIEQRMNLTRDNLKYIHYTIYI